MLTKIIKVLALVTSVAAAAVKVPIAGAEPNPPQWPDSVSVFHPGDPTIVSKVAAAFAENGGHDPTNHGQFSSARFAFLFQPGTYTDDVPMGYYTQVLGLGTSPGDTVFTGDKGVYSEEGDFGIGGALSSFWRGAENFRTSAAHKWATGTGMMWAVSQGTMLRSVQVDNDLVLYEYEPPIPQAGEASGGYISNMKVGGTVQTGAQQQWFCRNSDVAKWNGGVWNIVFVGVEGAPPTHCGDTNGNPFTTVDETPLISEKPYITIDTSGKFSLQIPKPKTSSSGNDFSQAVTSVPFDQVYVTQVSDSAATINAKLSMGLHVVVSPGIYNLNEPLQLNHTGQVLLGIGYATLVSANQNSVIEVASGVDDVRIGGFLLQAGKPMTGKTPPDLLLWGSNTSYAGKASLPGVISDVFARIGGPDGTADAPVAASTMFNIKSGNVIGDNMWLWRADHADGGAVTYTSNPCNNGLLVSGDDVIMYGLAVEHVEQDLVSWSGENGRTYFFQSELPYGVTQAQYGDKGYAGYRVAPTVKSHGGWGIGVYAYFRDNVVVVQSGIVVPPGLISSFINPLSVYLNGQPGSGIVHVINGLGNAAINNTGANYVCPS
eukprot:m.219537 g.219537  ORF g.219537 m.219537 type:complete len:602 (-) comp33295_c0_seq1:367-2172(-)